MHRLLGSLVGALATAALYAGSAAPALAQAADLAICKGEDADAGIPACTRLIERGTRLSPAERAAAFFNSSSHNQNKGDGDRRLRDLDEAIRLQPKHAQAWSARAWVYFWQGDHARAFRELDEAIRLEPSADHYRERGSAAYQLEKPDYDRAIRDFNTVIRLEPRDHRAYRLRAQAHYFRKNYDLAIADLSEALPHLGPDDPAVLASALNMRGAAYVKTGAYDRALADLDQAKELLPGEAAPYKNSGLAYEGKGELDKASAAFRMALSLDPAPNIREEASDGLTRVETRLAAKPGPQPAIVQQPIVPQATAPQAVAPQPKAVPPTPKEKRVALVIGNGAYARVARLANPMNDAADMAAALRVLGFEVVEGRDLDFQGMRTKVREFSRKLEGADLGLFFYAGHGVQVAGENYLVPVDATLENAGDLGTDAIELATVLAPMENAKRVNIVLLDACRDNPFTRSLRRSLGTRSASVSEGLAAVRTGSGTLIAFATEPDNVAFDGDGTRNAPFTAGLLKHIQTQGVEVEALMKRVRQDVIAATKGKQTPWSNSSLVGDVFLAQ